MKNAKQFESFVMMSRDIWIACSDYLEKLGAAEYRQQRLQHKKGKFTYRPSEYHEELIKYLGTRDENAFKALKSLQGRFSALGH